MKIQELYKEAKEHYSLRLLIEYLVHERKILSMSDGVDKLHHYTQEKYWAKMGEYLRKYEEERGNE